VLIDLQVSLAHLYSLFSGIVASLTSVDFLTNKVHNLSPVRGRAPIPECCHIVLLRVNALHTCIRSSDTVRYISFLPNHDSTNTTPSPSRGSSVSAITRPRVGQPGSDSLQGQGFLFSSPRLDRLWYPPSLLSNGYGDSFLGVKRPEHEVDHSHLSDVEVKNAWSYTSTPPCLHGMVQIYVLPPPAPPPVRLRQTFCELVCINHKSCILMSFVSAFLMF